MISNNSNIIYLYTEEDIEAILNTGLINNSDIKTTYNNSHYINTSHLNNNELMEIYNALYHNNCIIIP